MAAAEQVEQLATQVLARLDHVQTVDSLSSELAHLSIDEAYRVQLALVAQRCARGEQIVGRKVAFTSRGTPMAQSSAAESL